MSSLRAPQRATTPPVVELDQSAGRGRWRPGAVTALVVITALATALRLATADVQSVWLDESIAMRMVARGFGGMLAHLPREQSTPPLYYVLLWLWTRVFGSGVVAVRGLSVLAGTLTLPLVYLAGRRFSVSAGLWAAALAATSAELFYYSQEARPYALLILLSAGAFVAWQRALEVPGRRTVALWAGLSALALLTHYFAIFLFVGEAAVLGRRHGWRRVLAPLIAVGLVGAALVPLAVSQSAQTDWIAQTSLIGRIAEALKELFVGPYGPAGILVAPLAALFAAGGIIRLWRSADGERRPLLEIGVVGAASIALPALLALSGIDDVFKARNLVAGWLPWAVLVAAGLAAPQKPRAGAGTGAGLGAGTGARLGARLGPGIGAGLCAISLIVIAGTEALPAYQRDDWRDAARALPSPASGGRFVVSARHEGTPLSIYLPGWRLLAPEQDSITTREVDFVFLRAAHSGRWGPSEDSLWPPTAPSAPTMPPAGFRLVAVRRTAAYATYRYLAPTATVIAAVGLRRSAGYPNADIGYQPRPPQAGVASRDRHR